MATLFLSIYDFSDLQNAIKCPKDDNSRILLNKTLNIEVMEKNKTKINEENFTTFVFEKWMNPKVPNIQIDCKKYIEIFVNGQEFNGFVEPNKQCPINNYVDSKYIFKILISDTFEKIFMWKADSEN